MDVTALGSVGPAAINPAPAAANDGGFDAVLGAIGTTTGSAEALGYTAVGAQPAVSNAPGSGSVAVPGIDLIASQALAAQPPATATSKVSLPASAAVVDVTSSNLLLAETGAGSGLPVSADAVMSLDPGVAQEPKGNAAGAKLSDPSEGVQVAGEPPAASLLPVQPAAGELPAPFPEAPTEIVSEAALADAQAPEDTTDEVQPDAIAIPAAVAASDVAVIPAALQPNNVPLSQAAFAAQPQLTLAGMEQVSAEQQESPAGDQPGAPVTGTAAKGATSPEVSADAAVQPFAQLARSAAAEQPQANVAAIPGGAHSGVPQAQPGAQAAVAANASTQPEPVMQFRADKAAREMGLEIARRVSSGGEELVIRLDPGELGRINIRMAVNEHGQLRAVVAADAPAVLEALRSDISELNRALEQAGVRTDSQSFRFDRGGSGDSGGQWQQRYQQQASTRHGGTGDPSVTAENNPAYRPMSTNGRVNVMA